MAADPLQIALRVAEILERLGIAYWVGGSVASSIVGTPRSTHDVDMVADLRPENVDALVSALEGAFYVDRDAVRQAVRDRSSFNAIHLDPVMKVDVFVCKETPFHREELRRRVPQPVPGEPGRVLFVSTAEDIVLEKLEWYRKGGRLSDRQWNDVLGVLKVQAGRLDRDYLQRGAETLGIADLLDRSLRESGLAE